jgi:hypothetical protein
VGASVVESRHELWTASLDPIAWIARLTDAGGRVLLPRGDLPLYVRLGPDAGWAHKPGSVIPPPDVKLRPGVVVRGWTLDSDGKPVTGAIVRAQVQPPGAGAALVVESYSAADGSFETAPLPFDEDGNGRQEIDIVAYSRGLVPGSVTTTRTDGPRTAVVVTLYRGGALRGRLVRADGSTVSSAVVALLGTHLAAIPLADGRFELRLPAQGGDVFVHDFISSTSDAAFRPLPGDFVATRRLGSFRGDSGDRDLGDVVVDDGKPLRGVVVRANGDPVASARVTAVLAGAEVLSVHTDAKGAFEMPLSGEAHDLVVNEQGSGRITNEPALRGVRGGGPDVRIVREAATPPRKRGN